MEECNFQPEWVLGCMSGTSMDGVDVAEVKTDGIKIVEFGKTQSIEFSPKQRQILIKARGKWPGEKGVWDAAKIIEDTHLKLIKNFHRIKHIGFHGQTLIHDPASQRTHQVGSASRIANVSYIPVISEFRAKDLKNGGQGAPLVPFFHHALSVYLNQNSVTAFVNIGGIANITVVNPNKLYPESGGVITAFDAGPGNYLLDTICQHEKREPFDKNGLWARSGRIHYEVVNKFEESQFIQKASPKSADLMDFDYLLENVSNLSTHDKLATLVECTAVGIRRAILDCKESPQKIGICGGGAFNQYLIERIEKLTNLSVETVDQWGMDPQFIEAQAFAYLAVRCVRELPITSPITTGCKTLTTGGKLILPNWQN